MLTREQRLEYDKMRRRLMLAAAGEVTSETITRPDGVRTTFHGDETERLKLRGFVANMRDRLYRRCAATGHPPSPHERL